MVSGFLGGVFISSAKDKREYFTKQLLHSVSMLHKPIEDVDLEAI